MSGKFTGSWTVGLIAIARGQDCFTWSSGKASTTPLTPRVENHLNTLRTHPMLSRHSIRPIQTSQLPESIKRGPCLIFLLIYFHPLNHLFSIMFSELLFFSSLILQFLTLNLHVRLCSIYPPQHLPHHAFHLRFPDRHLPHRPLLPKHRRCHNT